MAEKIYLKHDHLIVARVDCTKNGKICESYGIESYPTILYLNKDTRIKYKGDRSEDSLISFADRLTSPGINKVVECNQLKAATNRHGLIVLSTITNSTDYLRIQFESLANIFKSDYWFYQFDKTCKDFIKNDRLYLLKRHLDKAIEFKVPENFDSGDFRKTIMEWIRNESFPIYGTIHQRNIERYLTSGKLLILAILDEYKPAKRFSPLSHRFHKSIEGLARKYAQYDEQLLFGWTSDLELVEYITISSVSAPNLMLLKPGFLYHLTADSSFSIDKADEDNIPEKLREANIRSIIAAAKAGKVHFSGGNSYLYVLLRHIFSNYRKFIRMYKANPLLVALIFGFPSVIIIFVIYTTCCYDGPYSDDEEELFDEDERQQLLSNGHLKQD